MTRFCTELQGVKEKYETFSWDCIDGLRQIGIKDGVLASAPFNKDNPIVKPLDVLTWFETYKDKSNSGENKILFLKDFHNILKKDFGIIRKIRNVIPSFKAVSKVLVIVCPVVDIPHDIEKEVTVVNFGLPDREELKIPLRGICASVNTKYPSPELEEKILDASMGMTGLEAENAYAKSLVETKGEFDATIIRAEKASIVRKTGLLEVVESDYTLDDIGGLEILKNWLIARKDCFTEKARKFGIKPPKGLLIVGVPGCGKSLTCKAVSKAWNRPLLRLDVGKIYGSLVGESEGNVRKCLSIAGAIAPCVLWIDELEKSFAGMKGESNDGHGTSKRVFGTFLNWMQDKKEDVFIVATANNVDSIPGEMLRSGRFDCMFWVDLPSPSQRMDILKIHLGKVGRDAEKVIDGRKNDLTKASENFSGAEIEVWVQEALNNAFEKGQELSAQNLIDTAIGITPIAQLMKDSIQQSRQWAESRNCKNASIQDDLDRVQEPSKRKLSVD
jgi:SpoVK/Ycf46/Vps4 family AAA+-type ATPase